MERASTTEPKGKTMPARKWAACLAAAAILASAPVLARTAAPLPAAETNLGAEGGSTLFTDWGTAEYAIAAVVAGLAIWGIVELVDDNDEPVSP
jgi:hypothetical protein